MNHKLLLSAIAALTIASGAFAQTQTQRAVQRGTVQQRGTVKKGTVVKQGTITEQQKEAIKKAGQDRNTAIKVIGQTATNQTSSDQSAAEKDKARKDEINQYFTNNASKDNAKALTINVTSESLPPYIQMGTKALELVTETVKVNDQSDQIFAANYENIYPGAIVFADANLANGDPTLAFDGGTVDLRVNFNTGNKSLSAGQNGMLVISSTVTQRIC